MVPGRALQKVPMIYHIIGNTSQENYTMIIYTVVILQDNDIARLPCESLEEAQRVRQSFLNYGKCQDVTIEKTTAPE